MKKVLFVNILLLFCTCDKLIDDDFIIINNCSDEISITIVDILDRYNIFNVAPKTDTLFLEAGGIPRPQTSEMIKKTFKHIDIIKNGISGEKDYLNQRNWMYDRISDEYYKWYLIINSEDFE